jgi:hypothetical protein
MNANMLYSPIRWISHLVLVLMLVAVAYSAYTAIRFWPGIAV